MIWSTNTKRTGAIVNVVVDTNVVAYYWLPGSRTEDAIALRFADQ